MADTQTPGRASMISNIIAIIGFIVLAVIVVWGLIHIVRLSSPWFSSLFDGSSAELVVSAPKNAQSGQPVRITWEYETDVSGTYAFMYACTPGLQFRAIAPNNALLAIPCGAAFTAGAASSTMTVVPFSTGTTTVQAPISIVFLPSQPEEGEAPVRGNATIAIAPGATPPAPQPSPQPSPSPTPQPKPTPKPTGSADISVTITSLNVDQFGNGIVTFNISNIGSASSGSYFFTAQLPTSQPYTYVSTQQASLSPGSYVSNTLRFTQGTPGVVSVFVTASDSNKSNNSTTRQVNFGGYSY